MINERTVEKSSKNKKGGVKMKELIIGLVVVGLVGMMAGMGMAASTDTHINLYVTPIVITSLTISSTFYNFGLVDAATSTGSVSALTLTNNGNIDISVEKEVTFDDDWDIKLSSTTKDGFILWAMVSAGQPSHLAFENGLSSFSNVALDTPNNLTDTTGTQVSMSKDENKDLWFRLDMPYSLSTGDEQKITVRLIGTSN